MRREQGMRAEDLIGRVLSHYRIIRLLGYGGTAAVFLAEDINLHREVAVKVFQPREGETQEFLRRFAREARVLARLDHPHILPVYDYGEQNNIAYLVVPLMAGGSLKDRLKRHVGFIPAETVQLIGQILNALQYAHEHGFIHRDIKPGNMLFKADGTLVLADFGLVKVISPDNALLPTQTGESVSITGKAITGTPEYMSPEQIMSNAVPASDIYSVGVVLYEMLSGEPLFTAENYLGVLMKHLYTAPRPLRQVNPRISPALESVVMRCLAKEPGQRYQQPAELLRALQLALIEPAGTDHFQTAPTPPISPSTPVAQGHLAVPPTPYMPEPPQQVTILKASSSQPGHSSAPTQHSEVGPYVQQQEASLPATPTSYPTPRKRSAATLIVTVVVLVCVLGVGLSATIFIPAWLQQQLQVSVTRGQPSQQPTTSCPATGTARAASMAAITLGHRQNIIYVVNEGTVDNPTAGTIKRRDVTTFPQGYGQGVEISKMPNTYISNAQVSQDGLWVMFTAKIAGQYQLRLVRVDGQDLQTLYCAPSNTPISATQWSFNQKLAIFDVGVASLTTYLLDLTTGNLQAEVLPDSNLSYVPRTWLDNSRVYLVGMVPNKAVPPQNIYLLDLQKGANQHESNLQKLVSSTQGCTSFDTSYDVTQLFTSNCTNGTGAGATEMLGPSTISVQSSTGGTPQTIYTSATQAITLVRGISPTTLFFMVESSAGNVSQNGLWKIKPDGTGATQLTSDPNSQQSLCPFTQFSWAIVSRDGTLYTLQSYNAQTNTYALYYGSINSGTSIQFANISNTQLLVAGWTSM